MVKGGQELMTVLKLDNGEEIPFELKTTTDGTVTTARDFGHVHIEKWRNKHFLISKFSKSGAAIEYTIYGGPLRMEPWIKSKEDYIKPDYIISTLAPKQLRLTDLFAVVGEKQLYTIDDAKGLQKKQYSQIQYEELMDLDGGYSQDRILSILKERCGYLLKRGSTLNNPHISKKYFEDWDQITSNHAIELKKLVKIYLSKV